jgi:hypothetical protein
MDKVKEQKTVYPSQINTKAIACRISSADYVQFLNEAISMGISLNDWLLMKIYSNKVGKVFQNEDKIDFEQIFNRVEDVMPLDLYERYEESAKEEHIEFKGPAGLIYIIKGLSNNLEQLLDEQNRLLNDLRKKETVNIDSIKAQILTIAKDKIKSQRDLKEFMFEVNDLLNEIV